MAEPAVIARSPITPAEPPSVVDGWEVSGRRSGAGLTLVDCMPLAKVLVRAAPDGAVGRWLGIPFGRAGTNPDGVLVTGSGPDEWTLFGPQGSGRALVGAVQDLSGERELVSALDVTHGRALMRLTGAAARPLLSKLCAVDLGDAVSPNGAVFRSSVAKVITDVVRDDRSGVPSYLLHCERSYGSYLFGALLDAGAEFGIEVDGYTSTEMRGV